MKLRFFISLVLFAGIAALPSVVHAEVASSEWTQIRIEPENVSVAPSIREGEIVRVHVEDLLPNLCYRPGPIETSVDLSARRILLTDHAYYSSTSLCPMLVMPTSRTIEVGALPAGGYELWVNGPLELPEKKADFSIYPDE